MKVRCMAAVLFMVGRGDEDPSVSILTPFSLVFFRAAQIPPLPFLTLPSPTSTTHHWVVASLLDVERHPKKPQYDLASELPVPGAVLQLTRSWCCTSAASSPCGGAWTSRRSPASPHSAFAVPLSLRYLFVCVCCLSVCVAGHCCPFIPSWFLNLVFIRSSPASIPSGSTLHSGRSFALSLLLPFYFVSSLTKPYAHRC